MTTPPPEHDLEQQIHGLLRDQPLRRAPATLQSRVLDAIAARRAAPWWQRSFLQWPLAARLAFLVASFGAAGLALIGTPHLDTLLPRTRLSILVQLAHTGADTARLLLHGIPSVWLEGAAALAAVLYLLTFALGATAYRTLYCRI